MPSRTGHPGTRRAHTRKGKPVRSASIKYPQTQRRRNQVSRQVRQGRKPLLWGAGTLAGLGALEAILGGRFFTAAMLFGLAGGFLVGHFAWQHHKRRQVSKPARVSAAEQRRQALAKAREQQERTAMAAERKRAWSKEGLKEFWRGGPEDPEPTGTRSPPASSPAYEQPPPPQVSAASEARSKQRRYDEMQAMLKRQRRRGQTEMVWPGQYEEFFEGPGKVKPRPSGKPGAGKPHAWPDMSAGNLDYSLLSSDDPATHRFFQLRQSGYTGPIDKNGDPVTDADLARETARRRGEKPREGAK